MNPRHPGRKDRVDVRFVQAAHGEADFPSLGLPETALVGRSNVGKSSFLNALAGGRQVARSSRTPGRTRSINFYSAGTTVFVDLPGYGYARVSKEEREHWKHVIESYLRRQQLSLAIQIVDARTGATESDRTMHGWLRQRGLPTLVAVNKVDKVGRAAAAAAVRQVTEALGSEPRDVMAVSARTGEGTRPVWLWIHLRLKGSSQPRGGPT